MSDCRDNSNHYGPDNPHPLARLKTELVWEGKYDASGTRRSLSLPSTPPCLHRTESIAPIWSGTDNQKPFDPAQTQFDAEEFRHTDFRNILIRGDNKLALAALLEQFRNTIDLIYIDPPFAIGADLAMQIRIGDNNTIAVKEQSLLDGVAYHDTWGRGAGAYLHMIAERLTLIHELLSAKGSLFLHVGTGVAAYISAIADEIFGSSNRRNQIAVKRVTKNLQRQFTTIKSLPEAYDLIFWYTADPSVSFPPLLTEQEPKYPEGYWKDFWSTADRPTMRYELLGITPSAGQWKWRHTRAIQAVENYVTYCRTAQQQGINLYTYWQETGKKLEFLRKSPSGKVEHWVPPLTRKFVDTLWMDFSAYGFSSGYNTEKSESLLTRIIEHFTQPGDLVADCFCGSGTTLAVAEKLGRRWIGVDLGRYAIHTTRKRLLQVQREHLSQARSCRAFDIYDLGSDERMWWRYERLQNTDESYYTLILTCYQATPLNTTPHPLIHGIRGNAYVHIDCIDGIFTDTKLHAVVAATQSIGRQEVHCLAWEFEVNLALKKQEVERETGLAIRLMYIPRELMELTRAERQFFEAGYLEAQTIQHTQSTFAPTQNHGAHNPQIDVKLVRFAPALAEGSEKKMADLHEKARTAPFDFIDFWAVDFSWRADNPFTYHWHDFRTRKRRSLKIRTDIGWRYSTGGRHYIGIKAVDVFGIETTTVIEIDI